MRPLQTHRYRGFTLLELLLVLALAALLGSLVVPRLAQWLQSAQARGVEQDLRAELESLPRQAFSQGRGFRVRVADAAASSDAAASNPADGVYRLHVPPGWSLRAQGPLSYADNGMAAGGRLSLLRGDELVARWVVVPVTGEVRRDAQAQGDPSAEGHSPGP